MLPDTGDDDLRFPDKSQFIQEISFDRPLLTVTIDTEEEFDWNAPFSRQNTSVTAIQHLHLARSLLARFGVIPTYVVDYPVLNSDTAWGVLKEIIDANAGIIGAQLHPWVTPPHVGELNEFNSYPGNLPHDVEANKIREMTERIRDRTGVAPVIYKAGRYGVGRHTAKTLAELGYLIDMSVHAHRDYSETSGPNFLHIPPVPYWFFQRQLLEIPLTAGYIGAWRAHAIPTYQRIASPWGRSFRMPGILRHLNLINRVTLTPEGVPLNEAIALTQEMLRSGRKVFSLAFHSTSLEPGNTSYVRSQGDLDRFLKWLEDYLTFFLDTVGGSIVTPLEILSSVKNGESGRQTNSKAVP